VRFLVSEVPLYGCAVSIARTEIQGGGVESTSRDATSNTARGEETTELQDYRGTSLIEDPPPPSVVSEVPLQGPGRLQFRMSKVPLYRGYSELRTHTPP